MLSKVLSAVLLCLVANFGLFAQHPDRNIFIETVVDAHLPEVWKTFTTEKGLESFFAPECRIDLRVNGKLDIFFSPGAPKGRRGAEGMRILSVIPYRMFGFTWNTPPGFPEIRNQLTHVTIKFYPAGPDKNRTRLYLIHDGWGEGEMWDEAYRYFVRSWRDVVLFRLHYRFAKGPVDWRNPPKNLGRFNIIVH